MLRFAIPFMLAAFTTARVFCKQTIEKRGLRAVQKRPDARRARNRSFGGVYPEHGRRTQDRLGGSVFTDTLKRGDQVQRSRWGFFNSLYLLLVNSFNKPARLDLPHNLVRDELFRSAFFAAGTVVESSVRMVRMPSIVGIGKARYLLATLL